ncbi:DUF4017 family protein [Metabacillus indicus]|uniref:DUF4017 family protein n=1 Tax=Metabacillus indicus TaxID=246786 RepID=UPI00049379EA|nr:DUF4017 family protein [Metabacillus indicus]KEZ50866.1 hypothetical protein AZ46_0209530 [Metabacillus indicus LMG 22858]
MKLLEVIMPPVVVYLVICLIGLLLPVGGPEGSGYDTKIWNLYIIQVYAIPGFLIALMVSLFANRKKKTAG